MSVIICQFFYVSSDSETDRTIRSESSSSTYRITEKSIANMFNTVAQADWNDVYNSGNVNEAYKLFSDKLSTIYDDCIPLVTSTIKRNPNEPWLTQWILVAIKKKHRYYRDSSKKKTQYAVDKYKIYRNKLTNLIRTAQKKYYAERFEDVRNDIKRT